MRRIKEERKARKLRLNVKVGLTQGDSVIQMELCKLPEAEGFIFIIFATRVCFMDLHKWTLRMTVSKRSWRGKDGTRQMLNQTTGHFSETINSIWANVTGNKFCPDATKVKRNKLDMRI